MASFLRNILEESKFDPCWQLCQKDLLWILTVGGFASSSSVHRSWYVQHLTAVSTALEVFEWEEAENIPKNYVWLESSSDMSGQLLWIEVINAKLPRGWGVFLLGATYVFKLLANVMSSILILATRRPQVKRIQNSQYLRRYGIRVHKLWRLVSCTLSVPVPQNLPYLVICLS